MGTRQVLPKRPFHCWHDKQATNRLARVRRIPKADSQMTIRASTSSLPGSKFSSFMIALPQEEISYFLVPWFVLLFEIKMVSYRTGVAQDYRLWNWYRKRGHFRETCYLLLSRVIARVKERHCAQICVPMSLQTTDLPTLSMLH